MKLIVLLSGVLMAGSLVQAKSAPELKGKWTWSYQQDLKAPKCMIVDEKIAKELKAQSAECSERPASESHDGKGGLWYECKSQKSKKYFRYIYPSEEICQSNLKLELLNNDNAG